MKTRTIIGPPTAGHAKRRDAIAKQLSKLDALTTKQERAARPSQWEIAKILKANRLAFPRTLAETDQLALQVGFSTDAVVKGISTEEVLRVAMMKFAAVTWPTRKPPTVANLTREISLAELADALDCSNVTAGNRLKAALVGREKTGRRYRVNLSLAGVYRQQIEQYLTKHPQRPTRLKPKRNK